MNIILRVASKTWFTDREIATLPRYAQIPAMQYGVAVTHAPPDERTTRYWMGEQQYGLWRYLNQAENTIVGFNQIEFDLPIVLNAMEREEVGAPQFTTFDIFHAIKQQTGRWYRLADLATRNLERAVTTNGAILADLLRAKKPMGAIEALEKEVSAIRGLYGILVAGKPLLLPPLPNDKDNTSLYFWAFPQVRHIVADPNQPALTLNPTEPDTI